MLNRRRLRSGSENMFNKCSIRQYIDLGRSHDEIFGGTIPCSVADTDVHRENSKEIRGYHRERAEVAVYIDIAGIAVNMAHCDVNISNCHFRIGRHRARERREEWNPIRHSRHGSGCRLQGTHRIFTNHADVVFVELVNNGNMLNCSTTAIRSIRNAHQKCLP